MGPATEVCSLYCVPEEVGPETRVLHARGEVDLFTAPRLVELALSAGAHTRALVLDLAEVRFIDSAGIAGLVRIARGLGGACDLVMVCPAGLCRSALDLVQLPRLIPTYLSLAEALDAVSD